MRGFVFSLAQWLDHIHQGDGQELMRHHPDGCVDLVVASPAGNLLNRGRPRHYGLAVGKVAVRKPSQRLRRPQRSYGPCRVRRVAAGGSVLPRYCVSCAPSARFSATTTHARKTDGASPKSTSSTDYRCGRSASGFGQAGSITFRSVEIPDQKCGRFVHGANGICQRLEKPFAVCCIIFIYVFFIRQAFVQCFHTALAI